MADKNYEKQFYSSILNSIDRNDSHNFYNEMSNAIKSGKMDVFIRRSRQQLSFDATWINQIKDYLRYVENIVRNPRIYMLAVEEVTPIQRAKKINARSIQHLSSHVQNVQEFRKDGTIVPSKVLSTTFEDTFSIYENRFIMTLINKLAAFVEVRYTSILESIKSYQADRVVTKSKFTWRNYTVEATIDLNVREEILDEVNKRNQELLDQIVIIRNYTKGFMNSSFYQTMKERTRPITPPILRTNIITKSVDYNSCLKLWLFLDSYRQLGVDLEVMDKELKFDNDYLNQVADMILMNYSLVASNQEDRKETYELKPYRKRKDKTPKYNRLLVATDDDEILQRKDISEPTISEYFYQRVKKVYKHEFTEQVNSGISFNKSFMSVYHKMQRIENGIQDEIIESMESHFPKTNSIKEKRKAKFKYLKQVKRMYQTLIFAKQQDVLKAQAKLDKTIKTLERYEKEEKEYQAELRRQRLEQLRAYQASKKKKVKEEEIKETPKVEEEKVVEEVITPKEEIKEEIVAPIEKEEPVIEEVKEEPKDEAPKQEINPRNKRLMEYLQKARLAARNKEVKVNTKGNEEELPKEDKQEIKEEPVVEEVKEEPKDEAPKQEINPRNKRLMEYLQKARLAARNKEVKVNTKDKENVEPEILQEEVKKEEPVVEEIKEEAPKQEVSQKNKRLMEYLQKARLAARKKEVKVNLKSEVHHEDK